MSDSFLEFVTGLRSESSSDKFCPSQGDILRRFSKFTSKEKLDWKN